MSKWRVGTKVPLNIYDGDRPVCQCHKAEDATNIAAAMNGQLIVKDKFPFFSLVGVVVTMTAIVLIVAFAVVGLMSAVIGGIK